MRADVAFIPENGTKNELFYAGLRSIRNAAANVRRAEQERDWVHVIVYATQLRTVKDVIANILGEGRLQTRFLVEVELTLTEEMINVTQAFDRAWEEVYGCFLDK